MAKTPEDVLKLAEESGAQIIDFKFIDLPGVWQHFSIPATEFDADMFTDGLGFDGSSIRGFQQIHESDMLLMPDPNTAYMDPMRTHPTLSIICNIEDPLTRQPYSRDPRHIAQKAEAYLKGSGIADTSYWGPEPEFYIFNDVKYGQSANGGFYSVDSGKVYGTPARQRMAATWDTSCVTKRATSRFLQPTACRTSAAKWRLP